MNRRANEGFVATAEFDPRQAVWLFWPPTREPITGYNQHKPLSEAVKVLTEKADVDVYINCGMEGLIDECRKTLTEYDVDIEKIHFTQFPDNTWWARDYGPDILVDGKGNMQLASFDFIFYAMAVPGSPTCKLCEGMNAHTALHLGCRDIMLPGIFSEGGDREVNGAGVLITIEDTEVRKRNPGKTRDEIEQVFKDALNLEKVIWLPLGPFEDEHPLEGPLDIVDGRAVYRSSTANGHVDEMCRFVGRNTVLLADVDDEEVERLNSARINKERLDAAYEVLKNSTDAEGNPLNIIRIPSPEPIYIEAGDGEPYHDHFTKRMDDCGGGVPTFFDGTPMPSHEETLLLQPAMSYCNFLICNKVVLAQSYWSEGLPLSIKEKDEEAKRVLESVFPDREIVPINTLALNICGGGIHCMTKDIPVAKWTE